MPARTSSAPDTRQRIVDAAASLMSRQGYAATGLKSVVAESGATYGSMYHFFPDGKEALGAAAIRAGGSVYRDLVDVYFPEGVDVVEATDAFFAGAAELVRETGYADACPIATITLETASISEPMREAAHETFESWLEIVERRFFESGMAAEVARAVAVQMFCLIEGAFLMARAAHDAEAMDVARVAAVAAVESGLRRS